jgi:hypothetical protein
MKIAPANDLGRLAPASEVAGGHAIKCFKIGRPCAALFKMVRYVLLRPLRLELDISWSNFHGVWMSTLESIKIVLLYMKSDFQIFKNTGKVVHT